MNKINLIYVIGVSYSGSTLLSYFIGASKEVLHLGELKRIKHSKTNRPNRLCTCGEKVGECPFWKDYNFSLYEEKRFFTKAKTALKVLLKRTFPTNQLTNTEEHKLLTAIKEDKNNKEHYYLDASKSLWRLTYLMNCKDIDLKVVYIDREIKANVSSFSKRNGKGFWEGLTVYILQHILVKRFLAYHKGIDSLSINYADLIQDTNLVMQKIGNFLGLSYDGYEDMLKEREYHVITGNTRVTTQFRNGFKMRKRDDGWKGILTPLQKKIIDLVAPKR